MQIFCLQNPLYSYRTSDFDSDAQETAAQINKLYTNNLNNETDEFTNTNPFAKNNIDVVNSHRDSITNDGNNIVSVQSNVDENRAGTKNFTIDQQQSLNELPPPTPTSASTAKTAKILVSKTKTKTGLPLLLKSSLKQ